MANPLQREIIWFFTLARKFPKLIGRLHDGTAIPGGPYTPTQLAVIGMIVGIGWYTRRFWSLGFGIFDLALLLPLAWVVGYAVGAIPLGSHSPFVMANGIGKSFLSGATGQTDGRTLKLKRPHFVGGVTLKARPAPMLAPPRGRVEQKTRPAKTRAQRAIRRRPEAIIARGPAQSAAPKTGIQHLLAQTREDTDQVSR